MSSEMSLGRYPEVLLRRPLARPDVRSGEASRLLPGDQQPGRSPGLLVPT